MIMTDQLRHHPAVQFSLRFAQIILFAVLGIFFYALAFQILVSTGLIAADLDGEGYGYALTQKAVVVWLLALLVAVGGLFVQAGWRWPLWSEAGVGPL